jgi:two-component system response regulator CpxR
MNMQPFVLIADDDDVLASMLVEYLSGEGFVVRSVCNGSAAVASVSSGSPPDLVVLDIMMPQLDGIEALREIRRLCDVPVIMLTARGDDLDRILGLELGADDYVAKPCHPRELLARIRAVLRRGTPVMRESSVDLRMDDIALYPGSRRVVLDGQGEISLTQTQFDLLHLLLSTPDQVVTKEDLSLRVLGKPLEKWDRSIDVHISNLRKKLGPHPDGVERIRTLRGSGYLYHPGAKPDQSR